MRPLYTETLSLWANSEPLGCPRGELTLRAQGQGFAALRTGGELRAQHIARGAVGRPVPLWASDVMGGPGPWGSGCGELGT